jgi:thiaminase (transcriptional activator TenA)
MTFSKDAWNANEALYETIRTMPFNQALAEGKLTEERFKHYIIQDAHYLIAFGRALAVAAAKADDPDGIVQFSEAAKVAIIVERALHGDYFQRFNVSAKDFENTPLSPACHHYSNYLIATAWAEPYAVALAALLPCFWIYAEVGKDIHGRAAKNNPYQAWIDTYAGKDFHDAVNAVIATTDKVAAKQSAETLKAMHHAFTRATQLEWIFWDSAWNLGDWPV